MAIYGAVPAGRRPAATGISVPNRPAATGRPEPGRGVGNASIPYHVVDAFSDVPFRGNPAAVCMEADDLSDAAMQVVAREMNLSETAFVYAPGPGGARRLRWFTPTVEVPLCGHATLASAHVLLREKGLRGPVAFRSASGVLNVRQAAGRLVMDLPSNPPVAAPMPPGLPEALGLPSAGDEHPGALAGPVPGSAAFAVSGKVAIVVLASEDEVTAVRPDFGLLARIALPGGLMGVAVTAPGDDPAVDFVSRFFGPWVGVDEDPVTGVAHTTLTPYWAAVLGKTNLSARQRSARGGELAVRSLGERVELAGHAVTVASGTLIRPA